MTEYEKTKDLDEAVRAGNAQQVRALIAGSADKLNYMTPFGTWLHMAAKRGHLALMQDLISMGIDVNARGGTDGGGAINVAAGYGQIKAVEALLAAGAELDVSEPERNPLFSAIQDRNMEIVRLLIAHGIDYRKQYTGEYMKGMDADAESFAREQGALQIADYLAELKSR